jgi:hypothetical protein
MMTWRGCHWLSSGHEPHRASDGTGDHLGHRRSYEELAVARPAFLAQGDHAALDAAIDACLARTERTLYTRWRVRAA